jgi:hypothetical protein
MSTGQKILLLGFMLLPILAVRAYGFLQKINYCLPCKTTPNSFNNSKSSAFSLLISFSKHQDAKHNYTIHLKTNPLKAYQ